MEQRDYLKDQIDQMGKALAKILSDLMGLKTKNEPQSALVETNQQLKTQVDLDLDKLMRVTADERQAFLDRESFNAANLETLAEILKEMGTNAVAKDANYVTEYFKVALELLNLADQKSEAISLERIQKKQTLEKLIEQYA
ncbi:MAG TPA: hypothetical protein VJ937_08995 [Salinivirga sp.]|uniref:hypothetical protein n=1 Tax=Salinivirga sp. TaxID=1970192 RepID=UPI002B46D366|nr:hypothetical protein [Salinivirga sp.]HKK59601.1 hypothetical protein [Salinivirga sp.]